MVPFPRYPVVYNITVEYLKGNQTVSESKRVRGTSSNMSRSGLKLDLNKEGFAPRGQDVRLSLEFSEPNDPCDRIELNGTVVWTDQKSLGIRLKEDAPSDENSRFIYESLIDGFEMLSSFRPVGHLEFE